MAIRTECLLRNKELVNAIEVLNKILQEDFMQNGFDACPECQLGIEKTVAQELHDKIVRLYNLNHNIVETVGSLM
ncbi:MAG: hypothetical protein GY853_04785 [PVC group bacterium]|nr:hypothetical protein [PVC group bacterium]